MESQNAVSPVQELLRSSIGCATSIGIHIIKIIFMLAILMPGKAIPDSKVQGANMGPIWGRQDPGGPHVGPMNFAIWAS